MIDKSLEGFAGVLLTDGYDPYACYAERTHDVVHAQCWAHTRQKFIEAASADPELAQDAVAHIGLLYEHEAWIRERGLTGKEKLAARAERAAPAADMRRPGIFSDRCIIYFIDMPIV